MIFKKRKLDNFIVVMMLIALSLLILTCNHILIVNKIIATQKQYEKVLPNTK